MKLIVRREVIEEAHINLEDLPEGTLERLKLNPMIAMDDEDIWENLSDFDRDSSVESEIYDVSIAENDWSQKEILHSEFYADVRWSPDDVLDIKPGWTQAQCEAFLKDYGRIIRDRLVEVGFDTIRDLAFDYEQEPEFMNPPSKEEKWG